MAQDRTPAWARALVARIEALEAAPARPSAKQRPRTFATLAERKAGNGFSCTCGRNDLRTAPHEGSFHKMPDGKTVHTL